ncbi:MAG TPA: protein GumC, partial [Deltaproteobacteria bacterium]|nr:protein GumC [Deltaproteobacteria bacterium]
MESQEKNIFEQLEVFYRRKWLIVSSVVICTALAVAVAYTMTPIYRSTTLILVEQQQVPTRYVTPTDETPVSERLSTIQQQIMSRTKLEQIIKDFDLYGKKG